MAAGTGAPGAGRPGVGEAEPAEQAQTLRTLVSAQVFSGAGLAAGVTVGALLAEDMLGATSLAGVPAALFTAGSAVSALGVGRVSNRYGRRLGLALGYALGTLGSITVVVTGVTGVTGLAYGRNDSDSRLARTSS